MNHAGKTPESPLTATTVQLRKSAIAAAGKYDYQKLTHKREGFLECSMEEGKEDLHITYDITGMKKFTEIMKEKKQTKLLALIDIVKFLELRQHYEFSLDPENLFYDVHKKVFVMQRDVYPKGTDCDPDKFLEEYKALTGCVLHKKYTYHDYNDGGLDLLKKDKFLSVIYNCETPEEIHHALLKEYDRFLAENKAKKMEVTRKRFKRNTAILVINSVLLAAGIGAGAWFAVWVWPYSQAVNAAQNAWLESDYMSVTDALEPVAVSRMDIHQKYILAESTVRSESLTDEQKENILSAFSLTGDEKVFDYWIYIGRLEPEKAVDIALQMSDDQMLLYAYMKQKYMIEIDTGLQGEEKSTALNAIEEKINELAKMYDTEEPD